MGGVQWEGNGNFPTLVSLPACADPAAHPYREAELVQHRVLAGLQVMHFKGALHRRYPNLKAAQLAWDSACLAGRVGPPKEWGAVRASEVAPKRRAAHQNKGFVCSGQPSSLPLPPSQLLPDVGGDLPQLYAIRFPPTPLAGHETWYIVIMGARPGVYAGW